MREGGGIYFHAEIKKRKPSRDICFFLEIKMSRTPETLPREMVLLSEKSGEGTSETLPRMMVFVSDKLGNGCVKYKSETEIIWDNDGSVFDPEAKIVAERAKIDDNLLNLRCGYSNRYWACDELGYLVANSKTPDEDKSKPSCTLFAIASLSAYPGYYSIQHIQTGNYIVLNRSFSDRLYVLDGYTTLWTYMDWESLVRLPDHVAFKRNNGKYLKAIWQEEHPYHQFSSSDPNDGNSGYQITHLPSGYIMIKSDHFEKFWRRSPNWIWADYGDTGDSTDDTIFWPIKIDDNTVALKSPANNHFLKPVTMDGKTDCLNAAYPTIWDSARFVVEELVLGTEVYDVTYQMDEARVYDEKPYVAGTTTATNEGDEEANISVAITYQDERSYSFNRGLSITGGVKSTIDADVLGIEKGEVELSFEIAGEFEWNTTTTNSTPLTATGAVAVPARSKGVVRYVGSKGTCDVPFHYTQRSTRSTDGQALTSKKTDGIFTGVNFYNFDFQFEKTQTL